MPPIKLVQKISTHILCSLFPKAVQFMIYCGGGDGTAGQATDENMIRSLRFACWVTKATDTHSEYVILIETLCYPTDAQIYNS